MKRFVNRSLFAATRAMNRTGGSNLNRYTLALIPKANIIFIRRDFSGDSHDDFKPKKKAVVPDGLEDVTAMIDEQVKTNPVMLYMKGTPARPQCGFSMQAVRILNAIGVEFSSVNVLEHDLIRSEIKNYSDWPTIPQLYVKGEFVGGCDIMTSMFNDGSMEELMKEKKLMN